MALRNRVVVVTGASGGIGRALCRQFAAAGARVAATDITTEGIERLAQDLRQDGADVRAYGLDVTSTPSVREAFESITRDFGQLDILVNNAGVWVHSDAPGPHQFETAGEAQWQRILDINLAGTMRAIQHALPHMIAAGYGRIVNLGSIAGEVGLPGRADYSAAKAGVIMLTKVLAMENAKRGITVNSVSPGLVARGPVTANPGTWLGRDGSADEIARAILFLADDDSAYITGIDFTVDGGRILGPHGA